MSSQGVPDFLADQDPAYCSSNPSVVDAVNFFRRPVQIRESASQEFILAAEPARDASNQLRGRDPCREVQRVQDSQPRIKLATRGVKRVRLY